MICIGGANANDFKVSSLEIDEPDTWMQDQFREHGDVELSAAEITAVPLLHVPNEKKASVNSCESLMAWHLTQSN